MRYLKGLYVRKFANRTILTLRSQLYYALLTGQKQTDVGDVMTKALSDADDWRLTLLVLIFPPLAYALTAGLKKPVTTSVANAQKIITISQLLLSNNFYKRSSLFPTKYS